MKYGATRQTTQDLNKEGARYQLGRKSCELRRNQGGSEILFPLRCQCPIFNYFVVRQIHECVVQEFRFLKIIETNYHQLHFFRHLSFRHLPRFFLLVLYFLIV